jgi:hypothetical protein
LKAKRNENYIRIITEYGRFVNLDTIIFKNTRPEAKHCECKGPRQRENGFDRSGPGVEMILLNEGDKDQVAS